MKRLAPSIAEVRAASDASWQPAFRGVCYRKAKEGQSKREDALERMAYGDDPITRTRAAYFVHLTVAGKARHIGTRPTADSAARLYDSALFHLFGWMKQPRGFNFYKDGEPTPEKFPEVTRLQIILRLDAKLRGEDPVAWDYDYSQAEDFSES
jgi:hypothetical protein